MIQKTQFQEQVIELIDKGLSVSEISRELNHPMSSVSSVIKRFSLKPKKNLNENILYDEYFDSIDSDEKAYFLGFLIADGTISAKKRSNGRIGILINEEDSYILEKLKLEIKSKNKIYIRTNTKGAINRKPQALFRWTSRHMSETLINKYGITPNKTQNTSFELNFNLIPEEFWGGLIRGFIDGDGSFESHEFVFNPSIVGTSLSWLKQIGDIVNNKTGLVYKTYKHLGKTCIYYTLRWSAERIDKFNKINKLYDFLYKGSIVFLKRKKAKVESYLEYRANQINQKISDSVTHRD